MLAGKLRAATAGAEGLPIEDLFSTYLYKGNGSTQTITNGIDLAGEGGLVWIKHRTNTQDHTLYDTERGVDKYLGTASNAAEATDTNSFSEFLSDGFTVASGRTNGSSIPFVSWTFRKAPRFFDVVTYTGDGTSGRTISHNLGVAPGMIVVKSINATGNWPVYHRSTLETHVLYLNMTNASANSSAHWNNTAPTDSVFTLGSTGEVNNSGTTYVAYLFAHNDGDGEFGPNGDQDIIKCGSYTGNGSTDGPEIDLGWEPQWVLIKNATTTGTNWLMHDVMRGLPVGGNYANLAANSSGQEIVDSPRISISPTGFQVITTNSTYNTSGNNYIYIAIRRGPMRAPESGTEVYTPISRTGDSTSNSYLAVNSSPVDLAIIKSETVTRNWVVADRLRGDNLQLSLNTTTGDAAGTGAGIDRWDTNTGVYLTNGSGSNGTDNYSNHFFRRAPGFFDVVAYAGNATVGRTVSHNLGVAPEMMIVKNRTDNGPDWAIYYGDPTDYLKFTNVATADAADYWNDTAPTESVFTLGNKTDVNSNGRVYIAYLFASLDGVSKVGSYTGNGSSQTINCGFTSGARFVLIKRTDSTGDWYVWDTARGIVTGNDPHLSLGDTSAQVTTDDSIDPDSSGFIVNQVAATNINVSSASYIYLAIS